MDAAAIAKMTFEDTMSRLKCGICEGQLHEPRLLACKHSYCETCIDNLPRHDNHITCPRRCETKTMIQDGGAHALETDVLKKELIINFLSLCRQGCRTHLCDLWPDAVDTDAKFCCINCELKICELCKVKHGEKMLSEGEKHTILSLSEKLVCSRHKRCVKYFCVTCDRSLCVICRQIHDGIENEKQHVLFEMCKYDEHWRKLDAKLGPLVKTQELLSLRKADIEARDAKFSSYKCNYDNVKSQTVKAMNELRETLITEIRKYTDVCTEKIEEILVENSSAAEAETLPELTKKKAEIEELKAAIVKALGGEAQEVFTTLHHHAQVQADLVFEPRGTISSPEPGDAESQARARIKPIINEFKGRIMQDVPSLLRQGLGQKLGYYFPSLDAHCSKHYGCGVESVYAPQTLTSYAAGKMV